MELQYVYTKFRNEFGRNFVFTDRGPELIDNYHPNNKLIKDYIYRNPVDQEIQCSEIQAEHEVNTDSAEYSNRAMNHTEGGWPKDININDEDQPKRYRRKIEKDDLYVNTVLQLAKNVENCILQNNSVNIYDHYFADLEPAPMFEKNSARTLNVYNDQCTVKRPITHISWSPDIGSKLAITYCNMEFQSSVINQSPNSYIWEVENPNNPQLILKPKIPLVCLEYNMKDPNSLVGGMLNGQVSVWDARKGQDPVEMSVVEESHTDPVRDVLWISSKSGSEFFSGSSDGTCRWWDVRKLSAPLEILIFDLVKQNESQDIRNAQGISCLEYEPTIPTRFMVGTEHGNVISGNRKGKTPSEKLVGKYTAHCSPVYSLQRNSAFVKNFLTVGDWTASVWSEDCKENPIIWTSFNKSGLTNGAWSPTRYSVFHLLQFIGVLDIWDILQNQKGPSLSIKICDDPLLSSRAHEMGRLLAVGNQKGTTYLVELSENLSVNQKNDKLCLTQMFERETHREKIMEAKLREIKLKIRTKNGVPDKEKKEEQEEMERLSAEKAIISAAEKQFYKIITDEIMPPEPEVPDDISLSKAETESELTQEVQIILPTKPKQKKQKKIKKKVKK